MDKVSIVIPVYNIDKYLNKCVDSIIQQTYSNLEIILVDDGSTDKSGTICDKFAKIDNRIRVIHKQNGGLSDARNVGIENATGKYICFIDGDDYIDSNMILEMHKLANENGCEMVVTNFVRETDDNKVTFEVLPPNLGVCDAHKSMKNMLLTNLSACNKLFLFKLFDDIKFPVGRTYEDIFTIPQITLKCSKIYFDDTYYYHYMQRNNSIIHTSFNINKMDYYYSVKEIFEISKKINITKEAECFCILALSNLLNDIYPFRKKYRDEYKMVYSEMKKLNYIKNNLIPKNKKIMLFLQMNNMVWLARFLKKIYTNKKYKKNNFEV